MSNKVKEKIVYLIEVKLASPLCISQGDGVLTDNDVLKDRKGNPFVPGASLAGAMRGYIGKEKNADCVFGYGNMESNQGRMSSLFVSDLVFDKDVKIVIRDGVALSENKTAVTGAKFNMEVVDTGACGHFWMELVVRENENYEDQLKQVFRGWKHQEIRLGSKKTRGYGEICLESVKEVKFSKDNISDYAKVYDWPENELFAGKESILDRIDNEDLQYITISMPLELEGAISIRQYAAKKDEPDFVQVTAGGAPVIPGTSFMGAIRHRMQSMLTELGASNKEAIIEKIFGYVKKQGKDSSARVSHIIINECVLEESNKLTMVRNGISRFESGTKEHALFKELSYVGGKTVLKIKVKNDEYMKETVGLLLLVLKDVQNGFLPVGGQTSVGRGLFSANGEISIDLEAWTEEDFMKAAYLALEPENRG